MNDLRFEWDVAKSRQNVRKHGVSFEDAETAFLDDHAIRFYDPDHSHDEDRFIKLGVSFTLSNLGSVPLLQRKRLHDPHYLGEEGDPTRSKALWEVIQ